MSVVGVVVIDCTDTGASPPTSTLPHLDLRLARRGATTGGGSGGIPRETDMEPATCADSKRHDRPVQTRTTLTRPSPRTRRPPHLRTAARRTCASEAARAPREPALLSMRDHHAEARGRRRLRGSASRRSLPPCGAPGPAGSTGSAREEVAARYAAAERLARLQAVESRREGRRPSAWRSSATPPPAREAAAEAHATAVRASGRRPGSSWTWCSTSSRRRGRRWPRLAARPRRRRQGRDRARRRAARAGLGRLVVGLRHLVRWWPGLVADEARPDRRCGRG